MTDVKQFPSDTIRLEVTDGRPVLGEAVSATATVSFTEYGRVQVIAEVGFDVVSNGRTEREVVRTDVVLEEPMSPGEHEVEFEVDLPQDQPAAYDGVYFDVEWFVAARLVTPNGESGAEALFEPQVTASTLPAVVPEAPTDLVERRQKQTAIGILVSVFGFGALLATLIEPQLGIILLAPLLALGPFAFFAFKRGMAKARFEDVSVEIVPDVVRPGEPIEVGLTGKARRRVRLEGIKGSMRATETTPARDRRTSATSVVVANYELDIDVPARVLQSGETFDSSAHVVVPAEAPTSITYGQSAVTWEIVLLLDIAWWPDFEVTRPIRVVSPRRLLLEPSEEGNPVA